MSVQGGSAVRLPAPADKLTPKDVFLCLCSQPQSGILLCWGHTSKGVCPFQDSYFFIQPLNRRQKKGAFHKAHIPFLASVQPSLPFPSSSLSSRREVPLLPYDNFSSNSNPSGIRPHKGLLAILCSWLLLQETLFPYHIVIYGAQSWVFTCRSPGWQVVTEPYNSDGFKPLPISCLNASGDRLCLCSWAKVGAWITALPSLMNREKNNSNEQFARLDKLSS